MLQLPSHAWFALIGVALNEVLYLVPYDANSQVL